MIFSQPTPSSNQNRQRPFPGQRLNIIILLLNIVILSGAQDDRLRLKRADVLENITRNQTAIQILTGDVVFIKGDVTVHCDEARYIEKTGQGFMRGNVQVFQREQTLTCDSLQYDSPMDKITGFGTVHIWDPDYDLTADTVAWFTELDSGSALGNVTLKQTDQTITSRRLDYVKHPDQDAASYKALGNVTIFEEERIATCGAAIYDYNNERTILTVQPEIREKNANRIIQGQEIRMQYQDEKLTSVFIPADAHVTAQSRGWREVDFIPTIGDTATVRDSVLFQDDMTSNQLRGYFTDGNLDSLRLEGMATTLYHIYEDSVYQGENEASGDTVVLQFGNDELQQIFVRGGAQGLFTPDSLNSSIEAPIHYMSDVINYFLSQDKSDLHGKAQIKYQDMQLDAGLININWTTNLLHALPQTPLDTLLEAIQPRLQEKGNEPISGSSMTYDLRTRRGKVREGRTKAQDGFYGGTEIRNEDKKTLYVNHSMYTTCDRLAPHFHFQSRKMKIISKDKIIARPIILYIAGIPVLALPLAILPDQSGQRHSGWIMPGYGETNTRGQFLDGFGYYWAPNPYWDTTVKIGFADRQGFDMKLYNRYKKRYAFHGNLRFTIQQYLSGTEQDIAKLDESHKSVYKIDWRHTQEMRNYQSFRANLSYVSNGEYNRTTGIDLEDRLKQQAVSTISYSKNWPEQNVSVSLQAQARQDLLAHLRIDSTSVFYRPPNSADDEISVVSGTVPSLSFRYGTRALIPARGRQERWYNNITWGFNSRYRSVLRTTYQAQEIMTSDTTSVFEWQLNNDGSGKLFTDEERNMTHSLSLQSPFKIFRYISVQPRLSMNSRWVPYTFSAQLDSTSNSLIRTKTPGFDALTTGNLSLSTNTQLYGLFPIGIGPLIALRHVASPSISYTYSPDFSQPVLGMDLGYVDTILDTSGQPLEHDRFQGTPAGSVPSSERQSMNVSLNNSFQAKVRKGDSEQKVDLFTWNMSSGYNFTAEEHPVSNLRSSIRTQSLKWLRLDISMTHDFYAWDEANSQRSLSLNRTSSGMISPRLTNVSLSTSFQLRGNRLSGRGDETDEESEQLSDTTRADQLSPFDTPELSAGENDLAEALSQTGQPTGGKLWSTSLSLRYSYNAANPNQANETFWLSSSTKLNLTKNWSVSYSARIDLYNMELVSHSYRLHRDLHCWEMSVDWTPGGYGRGLYLKINVKSPNLSDLKIEQRGGMFRNRPTF